MKAIVCKSFDSPLEIDEVPAPQMSKADVRIDVEACGVNFVDGLIVSGKYQLKPALPHVPGFEVSGRVAEIGADVSAFNVGDRVFATTGLGGGGYAEQAVTHESQVFHLPDALTAGQGATFVQSYCTALFALERRITLKPDNTLLVLGASGGVGRAALDVGRALGAKVIAAASSDERLETCRELGLSGTINYSREDLKKRSRELSEGGVDVVFDPLGGSYSGDALRALRDDGVLLIVGFAAGEIPQLPANHILLRNRRVVGVDWGGWRTNHPDLQTELMESLAGLVETGKLNPREPATYPLADAASVVGAVNTRGVVGKVVLVP